jgi:hypothetical protein
MTSRNPANGGARPKPWMGCDTDGPHWIAYCEAWEHAFLKKDPRIRGMIIDQRGAAAVEALKHNVELVRKDYRGELDDRAELPKLLRLQ